VDAGIWDQVGLKLIQINIESTIETQTGCNRADDLSNQTVQVLEIGSGNIQAAAADVVYSLVVNKESAVRVLDGAVGRQNGIVWFNNRCRDARGRVNGKFELAFLAVVSGEALKEKGTESGSGSSSK